MTDLRLYGKVISLKNRLEINAEQGKEYTRAQIVKAIELMNQVNAVLDRRSK
jgi:hypothetical protein